jgi:multiple sugar transport system substrate-binding protein
MRLLSSDRDERGPGAHRRRRQGLPVLAAMTAAAAVTPGLVAATSPVAGASTKTITITLGYAGGSNIDPYYDHVIAAAEKALPGVKVKQVVYSTYDEQLDEMPAQAAAGTIPNIIVWDNSAPVGQYAQNGAIVNLSQLAKTDKVDLGADPAALVNAWTIGGKLYGIPLYLQDSAYV